MNSEPLYKTTPVGKMWLDTYSFNGDDLNKESYQQMLIFFSGEGSSVSDAIKAFKKPIPPPLTPPKLQTQKLFDSIVQNFDLLFHQLISHGWIQRV